MREEYISVISARARAVSSIALSISLARISRLGIRADRAQAYIRSLCARAELSCTAGERCESDMSCYWSYGVVRLYAGEMNAL